MAGYAPAKLIALSPPIAPVRHANGRQTERLAGNYYRSPRTSGHFPRRGNFPANLEEKARKNREEREREAVKRLKLETASS